MRQILFCLFICSCFVSCQKESALDHALKLAGPNRPELEKVLQHYSANPADSLKYRATCFLIENMSGHYSYKGVGLDAFIKEIRQYYVENKHLIQKEDYKAVYLELLKNKHEPLQTEGLTAASDIHTITADYLIENIDFSFKVWQEKPWGKNISFENFCEEILPYRLADEPIENWKCLYYQTFQPVLDSLLKNNDPVDACHLLCKHLTEEYWMFDTRMDGPHLGAIQLLNYRMGNCREFADFSTYVMRALGIPSGIDFILQNPERANRGHFWNYVRIDSSRTIPFELYRVEPLKGKIESDRSLGKVYRQYFGRQKESFSVKYNGMELPSQLNNPFMSDVSAVYFAGCTVEMPIDEKDKKGDLVCLSVFNNKEWVSISCTQVKEGKATFLNVEPKVAYQMAYYKDKTYFPASFPLTTYVDGSFRVAMPDTVNLQEMSLTRKFPYPLWYELNKHYPIGGRFQGANREDFSDAVTLYPILSDSSMKYQSIQVDCLRKFKYLRYLSSDKGHCGMADVQFFSKSDSLLSGEVIGTDESCCGNVKWSKHAVFDNNRLTYFDARKADGSWAGLKLKEPAVVGKIVYIFRNDDNDIRIGDNYELLYLTDNEKVSLGYQTGSESLELIYNNVPSNAMYLLRNHTRGKEERIFTYENGKQVWW